MPTERQRAIDRYLADLERDNREAYEQQLDEEARAESERDQQLDDFDE